MHKVELRIDIKIDDHSEIDKSIQETVYMKNMTKTTTFVIFTRGRATINAPIHTPMTRGAR
jgi:hypothetical protein